LQQTLEAVEVTTGAEPRLSVIWLHGLGADGYDFEPIVAELPLPFAVRFVFPHAPVRPVTINGGLRMRAWFDVVGFGPEAVEDATGIRDSAAEVGRLIDAEEARGQPAERIVLAGFSQGGAIALYAGLRERRRLAGVLALSTYLPLASAVGGEKSGANDAIPLFMAHGTMDQVIPIVLAEMSRDRLREEGYAVEWHAYPMAHGVCPEEIRDIGRWLGERGPSARRAS
jgi:phospholipase/carboxylesterase